ncbi:MAG TPA: L,D-transpeptidase family protein [Pyrinomonadaceae bacterium]|nr:L,D-transpeptidase family protein [Pyrinomonadaceae bacterium]
MLLGSLPSACRNPVRNSSQPQSRNESGLGVFEDYLDSDLQPADGFDFPFGRGDGGGAYVDKATGLNYNGWYVATRFAENYSLGIHPGEDWNGSGGGNSDLGQDVFAVANGRVTFAANCGKLWGNVIVIKHAFYENHEKQYVISLYAHLQKINVRVGETVSRRQRIATIGQDPDKLFDAHLHLELRRDESLAPTYWPSSDNKDVNWVKEHYLDPSAFIKSHRKTVVPQSERLLVLVDQASYKMRLYERNVLLKEYDVSFGQAAGSKQREGDNRTPVGMYFVIQKLRGKFDGPYGDYYGGHWIKINYPNRFDAARGIGEGLINATQEALITKAWESRGPTPQNTLLGSGIGFHGWIREWQNEGSRHLSWGCVVLHLKDVKEFYDRVDEGTMVVIF